MRFKGKYPHFMAKIQIAANSRFPAPVLESLIWEEYEPGTLYKRSVGSAGEFQDPRSTDEPKMC